MEKAMASYTWTSAASGSWNGSTNWNPDGIPGTAGGDTATISATGANYNVTYNETAETLNLLTINSANATLTFNAGETLTVNVSTSLLAGTINLLNSSNALVNAGSLATSTGSVINIGAGDTVTYNAATLGGLVDLTGTTTFGTNSAGIALSGTIESTGGIGTVSFPNISGTGSLVANGATLLVAGSLSNSTVHAVISGSAASLFDATGAIFNGQSATVTFLGPLGAFEYNDPGTDVNVTLKTTGLNAGSSTTTPTNFIDLAGTVVSITGGGTGLTTTGSVVLSNGDTLALSGITGLGTAGWAAKTASDSHGGTEVFLASVCYAAGTQILTATGEKAVESLVPGDTVVTVSGDEHIVRPIKWLGRRWMDIASHPRAAAIAPVLIRRGAFADSMPHRDLRVSPDHGIFIDGKLICAGQLVNGTTICQEKDRTSVEYFHIELDAHGVVLAEGLPAESYLDTGNRGFFSNASEPLTLHPDLIDQKDYPTRAVASCHPLVWDEASVLPIWHRLADRAAALGLPVATADTTVDPAIRILACGQMLRPVHTDGSRHVFVLPDESTSARMISRAGSPADARPWLADRRCLGVHVERIVLSAQNEVREIPIDHPGLSQGWWAVEHDDTAMRRWTNGDAVLPLPKLDGPTVLEIHVGGSGMAYVIDNGQRHAA
jgi:hypothetical protein